MNPVSLLARIIAQGAKVSSASLSNNLAFEHLLNTGYLRKSGVLSSVLCNECEKPHDAELTFLNGNYGYFCPDLGWISVANVDVQAVRPEVSKLVGSLADAFQCKRRKTTTLSGTSWRIGAIETDQGDVMLFFHPTMRDEEDQRALHDALSHEMKSAWRLIVSAEGLLNFEGAIIVNLVDLVELDTDHGQLLPLCDPCTLVGASPRNPGGAPNRFGKLLTALIEERANSGQSSIGRNKEAIAVLSLFKQRNPNLKPPSLSSVNDYVTKFRTGQ